MSARIVSLVPSSTETLLALGADVVACTKYCEQPDLAHVGGSKNPDIGAIQLLTPDLVVLDREENRIEDHDALIAAGISVFVSDVTDLVSAFGVVGDLAAAAGLELPDGARHEKAFSIPEVADRRRRTAFVPIWRRPWMTISAATYGASLLSSIGVDVLRVGDGSYPTVELEEVEQQQPDLVLVPTEPYVFTDVHVAEIAAAVPAATVVRVDGQDLFWWGIRTPMARARLAAALGPRPRRR